MIVDNGGYYPNGTPNAIITPTNGDRGGRLTVKMGQSFVGSPTGLMLAGNATAPLQAVPLQQLTSAMAGGPFLSLTGGTVGGATTFSAAGTGLTVTNNLAIGAQFSIGAGVAANANATILTPNGSHINLVPQGTAHVKVSGGLGPIDFGASIQSATIAVANLAGSTGTGFLQSAAVSGTKNLAGITGFNQWNVSSDVAAMSGQFLFHTAINYNFGGGAYTGNRGGLLLNMLQTGAAAGTSSSGGIEGMQSSVTITNTFGGTNPGPNAAGSITAGNFYTRLTGTASNIIGFSGIEVDVEADTGAVYQNFTGVLSLAKPTHNQRGIWGQNEGFLVGGGSGSIGFDIGYGFTNWGIGSGATIFAAVTANDNPTFAVARGFDLRPVTFSGDIFSASGFAVGPTGRVKVGTGYFDVTGTGAALSVDGAICTAGTLTGAVTTTYASDGNSHYAQDPYGGVWLVTFPTSSTNITAITLVFAGTVKGSAPSNPVTLTPIGRLNIFVPAAITANLTWNTSRTTLALQPTTGGTITMPALQASTTFANDAAAATGGVAVGGSTAMGQ